MNVKAIFLNWKNIAHDAYNHLNDNDLGIVAAGISFYFLLAIFPAIGLGFALWTLFVSKAMFFASMNAVLSVIPPEGRHIFHDYMNELIAQRQEGLWCCCSGCGSRL